MALSTAGSSSFTNVDGFTGVVSLCSRTSSARVAASKRALASEDFVEHQAQRIDIALHGDFASGELLGRHVGGRSVADLVAGNFVGERGQAKVGDHHLAAAVEHDIGWFQIAMEDALGVRGGEAGAQLARDFDSFVRWQSADAAQQRAEIFAVDVFHRQIRLAFDLAEIVHAADIGMRDLARDADFIVEAAEGGWIARGHFGQEFERHLLAEREIVRAIDFSHAAAAEERNDPVAIGEQRSREKTAFGERT